MITETINHQLHINWVFKCCNQTDCFSATDCINGTIYNYTDIPQPEMNFTTFWSLANKWRRLLDLEQKFVPMQSVLTIYNNSRVYINLDGCVNTLKGECVTFLQTHGRDGANQTAQSRFPCFYKKVRIPKLSGIDMSRIDLSGIDYEIISVGIFLFMSRTYKWQVIWPMYKNLLGHWPVPFSMGLVVSRRRRYS